MTKPDLFADALWQFYKTGKADLRLERDDGYIRREDVSWYFTRSRIMRASSVRERTWSLS